VKEALEGGLDGAGLRVGVVVARFNEFVTSKLLDGCRKALADHGVKNEDVTVAKVPGSFEIPLAAQKMAESDGVDAVVCLGAVIRGETDHYEHVSAAASEGISNVSLSTGVPIGFGVLTTESAEQAIARAGGDHSDAGYAATEAAIEMANLLRRLDDI
jgi:6,7-dimethyl-8-ribityllumazine synthase